MNNHRMECVITQLKGKKMLDMGKKTEERKISKAETNCSSLLVFMPIERIHENCLNLTSGEKRSYRVAVAKRLHPVLVSLLYFRFLSRGTFFMVLSTSSSPHLFIFKKHSASCRKRMLSTVIPVLQVEGTGRDVQ